MVRNRFVTTIRLAMPLVVFFMLVAAQVTSAKTELLVFSSPYCGPCQQLKPTIAKFEQAGYPVRPVDVTQHPALATQFRVSRVPCLVMVADGREVARQLGGDQASISRMFASAGVQPHRANAEPTQRPAQPAPSLPAANPASLTQPQMAANDPFAKQLLETSVRITIIDDSGKSYGTGTIIDSRQGDALVVTCGHLFRGESAQGEILIERYSVTSGGLKVIDRSRGKLESYDLDRDVGLVSFRPNGKVSTAKVAAQFGEQVNGRVWSVGCDLGADPTVRDSRVTAIDRYNGPPNIETSGAPVQGRSGGGLFNRAGELVGVCFAADEQGDEGLYSGLASVHAELDRLGLQDIYRGGMPPANHNVTPATAIASRGQENLMSLPSRSDRVMRGQTPPEGAFPAQPPVSTASAPSPPTPAAAMANLAPIERASLEEIAKRAIESEVVVIVRPLDNSGDSELIKLDRVSPQFLQALRTMNR